MLYIIFSFLKINIITIIGIDQTFTVVSDLCTSLKVSPEKSKQKKYNKIIRNRSRDVW